MRQEPILRVERAEAFVLSFATWSFGLPAILKGFVDRGFVHDVSFTLRDGVARPNFLHIRPAPARRARA
jgi:putative NADPH-quinone reductase